MKLIGCWNADHELENDAELPSAFFSVGGIAGIGYQAAVPALELRLVSGYEMVDVFLSLDAAKKLSAAIERASKDALEAAASIDNEDDPDATCAPTCAPLDAGPGEKSVSG